MKCQLHYIWTHELLVMTTLSRKRNASNRMGNQRRDRTKETRTGSTGSQRSVRLAANSILSSRSLSSTRRNNLTTNTGDIQFEDYINSYKAWSAAILRLCTRHSLLSVRRREPRVGPRCIGFTSPWCSRTVDRKCAFGDIRIGAGVLDRSRCEGRGRI